MSCMMSTMRTRYDGTRAARTMLCEDFFVDLGRHPFVPRFRAELAISLLGLGERDLYACGIGLRGDLCHICVHVCHAYTRAVSATPAPAAAVE